MKLMVILSVLFLAAKADQVDDEDLESTSGGSGEYDYHELKWITFERNGGIYVMSADELQGMQGFIAGKGSPKTRAKYVSASPKQLEDGPPNVDHTTQQPPSESIPAESSSSAVRSPHFYPEYAIGVLENGCTAFMVGPQHALTAAHCVYSFEDSQWTRELDLWRGRNVEIYLQWMEWAQVRIPHDYFISGGNASDWALITFFDWTKSPVWLRFGYFAQLQDIPLISYGYINEVMSFTSCHSDMQQTQEEFLTIHCKYDHAFDGGPVVQDSNSLVYKPMFPPVYALSAGQNALRLHWNMFWSLCWLMDGVDSACGPL